LVAKTTFGDSKTLRPTVELPEPYNADFNDAWEVWNDNRAKHATRRAYYEGKNRLKNIGIAVPDELSGLSVVVGWPRKAVDELAKCSRLDGFTTSGDSGEALARISEDNGLRSAYRQAVRSELVNGLAFATVTEGEKDEPRARVRFYSAVNAACLWDYRLGRIKCGITVHDVDKNGIPTRYVLHEPGYVIEMSRDAEYRWGYEMRESGFARPMMVPLVFNADLDYPLGHSRITRAVMDITDRAVRECVRTELASEFAATPQKYLLGGTRAEQEQAMANKTKWEMYIGSVQWITKDRDGDVPQYGQLPQVSMTPHMDYFEHLAEEFAAETDIPIDALVRSKTYTSSESANADRDALVQIAESVNEDNGAALAEIAHMALAIDAGKKLETVDERVMPVFRDPARPSAAAQADWAMKVMGTFDWLAQSESARDIMLQKTGFTEDERLRIGSDARQASVIASLNRLTGE
jgi:hypothetical protein